MRSARATHCESWPRLIRVHWCWGGCAADWFAQVLHAHTSEEAQGFTSGWTAKLASYRGRNPARDFFRNTKLPVEPVNVTVIAKMPNGKDGELVVPVILPHLLVDYLVSECHLPIDNVRVRQYWSHMEAFQDTVAVSTRAFRQAAGMPVVPLCLYGDEAQIGLQNAPMNKVLGMNLSFPLFRPKATRLSRFMLFCVDSEQISSIEKTIFPILHRLTESLNHLTDHGIDGRRFICTELRGDQVWFRQLFRHQSYWIAKKVCFRCQACTDIDTLDYTDLDVLSSGWASTLRTTAQFVANEIPQGPLVQLSFFEVSLLKGCTLHILNLGMLAISNGSVLNFD
ncbi:Uncharacterized protein SCF082_LOCUS36433 [Durusdinium trenchii]|uniref:Uncharacterized protein n=1 Tax=Durusdinium trenchii TaxID=1381693 RepID=A0ABP0PHB6_9DINO